MSVTNSFRTWLKSNAGMKLSTDSAVDRVIKEGITGFETLVDFDKKSIQNLPSICKEAVAAVAEDASIGQPAEAQVPGANISKISTRRLIVAMQAAIYYTSIGRTMTQDSMQYTDVLTSFKLEWDDYESLKSQDDPTIPLVNDKDHDRKVIKWVPIFLDCVSRTYGSRGPLAYVLRDEVAVADETADPLQAQAYYGASGSLLDELTARLPHIGPIYKSDNATVYMMIEKAVRGTSVESTVKSFARRKDGRGAFQALIANHAGDVKYRAILKKRMNLLQNVKWNGRAYPLESHVSNHRNAYDDLRECSTHITVSVPNDSQRVEYLIDSINCTDNSLQAVIGLIRANTNNMRNDFELASSALIEVDPYKRSSKSGGNQREASINAIDFSAGRGPKTNVDLRWYPRKEFKALSNEQKDELKEWMQTQDGKKAMRKSRANAAKRKTDDVEPDPKAKSKETWKKKMKKALKTPQGLKTVMAIMAEEEKTNHGFVAALQSTAPAPAPTPAPTNVPTAPPSQPAQASASALQVRFPSTSVKLQSVLNTKTGPT